LKNIFFFIILFSLFFTLVFQAHSQQLSTTETSSITYRNPVLYQVMKDIRRWEIIAFGTFPFTMFYATLVTDMVRWSKNDWDRRYAPWPIKSAGSVAMTSDELRRTILIAAGVSLLIATIDIAIVVAKRNKERRLIENLPSGSVIIERIPEVTEEPEKIEEPAEEE